MPTVNLKDLTEKISPHAFAKYLSSTGWTIFPTKKDYIKIFQFKSTEDDFYQVIIPMDRTLSDYKSAMYEAVETVSVVEKQSTEQLMLYLLNLSKLKETTKQTVTVAKFATVDSRTSSPYDMKRLERAIGKSAYGGACLISKSAEPVKRASDEAKRASDEDAVVITLSEREQEIIDSMSGDKDV